MVAGVGTTGSAVDDRAFFGHPRGLFVCFATELWERFSFYGMKFLLLLYLTKYHLFSDANGLEVLGSYAALVYAMPVIGDRAYGGGMTPARRRAAGDEAADAIKAMTRQALDAHTLGFHHPGAAVVFRGNELNMLLLSALFSRNSSL